MEVEGLNYLEVRAAGGEDEFVSLDLPPFARDERDVDEGLTAQEAREVGDNVGLVVVPTETVLPKVPRPTTTPVTVPVERDTRITPPRLLTWGPGCL
jgi:hypothetical protein